MNLTKHFLVFSFLITLIACSVGPEVTPNPVESSKSPNVSELEGTYRLFSGSEISYGISEQNGELFASLLGIGQKERLQKVSPTRYKFMSGEVLNFAYSEEGKYDRFTTLNEGRKQQFIRDDALQRNRSSVTNQAVYSQQLLKKLKPGGYTYSKFISPSRAW